MNINYDKPRCPLCRSEMRAGVLSGGSDPTGNTDEYYCPNIVCEKLKVRVTIEYRDVDRIMRKMIEREDKEAKKK